MERPPQKAPLITPSASPPAPNSFFPLPYRLPDSAPPSKRQRTASAAPHTSSSSSSGSSQPPIDYNKEREESKLRLLNAWSRLEERYSRPLREDPIMDIVTGKVILPTCRRRNKARDASVSGRSGYDSLGEEGGDQTDEDEEEDDNEGEDEEDEGEGAEEAEEAEEGEEEEEDADELDTLEKQVALDQIIGVRIMPPLRILDPRDAADLKEFLEAERMRREKFEEGEDEDSLISARGVGRDQDELSKTSNKTPKPRRTKNSEKEITSQTLPDEPRTPPQSQTLTVDESDDELLNWDLDEASIVHRVTKNEEDSDSDIEIIEHVSIRPPVFSSSPQPEYPSLTPKPPKSGAYLTRLRSRPSRILIHQLQTPPQSQSSSSLPSDDYLIYPPDSSSPLPPSSDPPSSSPIQSFFPSSPVKVSNEKSQITQTSQTPKPPSRSKRPSIHTRNDVVIPPIPRLDLAKISLGRSKPKMKSASTTHRMRSEMPQATPSTSKSASASPKPPESDVQPAPSVPPSKGNDPTPKASKLRVEVVLERRTPLQSKRESARGEDTRRVGSVKGKEKEHSHVSTDVDWRVDQEAGHANSVAFPRYEDRDEVNDDPLAVASASPARMPKGRSARSRSVGKGGVKSTISDSREYRSSPARKPSVKQTDNESELKRPVLAPSVSPVPLSTRTRKRKRVVSSDLEVLEGVKETPAQLNETKRREALPGRLSRSDSVDSEASGSSSAAESDTKVESRRKPTPKQERSKSQSRAPAHFGDSSSEAEDNNRPYDPYYPYHSYQLPYAAHHDHHRPSYPHHPQHHPNMYPPVPDSRAQYIITQAMHQLSALVGGTYPPPMLYTPSSHHHSYLQNHQGSSLLYSTPTHHRSHSHPYPYPYDPNLSRETPPDSPPSGTSQKLPVVPTRKKSLVRRSRSRGRRVSFKFGEGSVGEWEEGSGIMRVDGPTGGIKGKKEKAKERVDATSEDESEGDGMGVRRGREVERAQTPGPPSHEDSRVTGVKGKGVPTRKARSRSAGGVRAGRG